MDLGPTHLHSELLVSLIWRPPEALAPALTAGQRLLCLSQQVMLLLVMAAPSDEGVLHGVRCGPLCGAARLPGWALAPIGGPVLLLPLLAPWWEVLGRDGGAVLQAVRHSGLSAACMTASAGGHPCHIFSKQHLSSVSCCVPGCPGKPLNRLPPLHQESLHQDQ